MSLFAKAMSQRCVGGMLRLFLNNHHRGRLTIAQHVHEYLTQEYSRTCLISFESLPKDAHREGWGRPGTPLLTPSFRSHSVVEVGSFCSTGHTCFVPQALDGMGSAFDGSCSILYQILVRPLHLWHPVDDRSFLTRPWCPFTPFFLKSTLDAQARLLIPSLPHLRPNDRLSHHFRFIAPLIPTDEEGRSPLHYYDSAIQLARQADREPTERVFEVGIAAADEIKRVYVPDLPHLYFAKTYTTQVCSRLGRKCSKAQLLTSPSFPSRCSRSTNYYYFCTRNTRPRSFT